MENHSRIVATFAEMHHDYVTSYGYDVHGWLVSQNTALSSGCAVGYSLEYAPCFNGNVARRVWGEGAYSYQYDDMNRLSGALFSPGEGSSADFSGH